MKHLPTVKEKMGVPPNRALEAPLETIAVKQIVKKVKNINKKAGMSSRVDPNNLTYYN